MKKWTSPILHASPTPCNCGGHCDSNKSCCDCPRFYGCLAPDGIEQCRILNPDRLPIVLSGGVFFQKDFKEIVQSITGIAKQVSVQIVTAIQRWLNVEKGTAFMPTLLESVHRACPVYPINQFVRKMSF